MAAGFKPTPSPFRLLKNGDRPAGEFWSSRDYARFLGIADDRVFQAILSKARRDCLENGHSVSDHFVEGTEMAEGLPGVYRPIATVFLSRYACFLIMQHSQD